MALNPRVAESQRRNFESVAQILLAKKQREDLLKQRTQEAELSAITNLMKDKNLPFETRADLANDALMRLRRPAGVTPGALRGREQQLTEQEALMRILQQAQGRQPEAEQQALDILAGRQEPGTFEAGLRPEVEADIEATEQLAFAREELGKERQTAQDLNRARIAKLKAETVKTQAAMAEGKTKGKVETESAKLKAFLDAAHKEMASLIITNPATKQREVLDPKRVDELRKQIKTTSNRLRELGGLPEQEAKAIIRRTMNLVAKGQLTKDRARFMLNNLISQGIPKEFIIKQLRGR